MSSPTLSDRLRRAPAAVLADALLACRAATLRTFCAYERAQFGPRLQIPYSSELNPPLWELGHVGWFQEYWIGRNTQLDKGAAADPLAARSPSRLPKADLLFDSSRVEHASRWELPLPNAQLARAYLEQTLDQSLTLLSQAGAAQRPGLQYFAWLALMHEHMHHEAALYMAQSLAIEPDRESLQATQAGAAAAPGTGETAELAVAGTALTMGADPDGFAFDNELSPHPVQVESFRIDREPVSNASFAEFIDAGGYRKASLWSAEGWAWRERHGARWPRYWRRADGHWQRREFGRWGPLDETAPVTNLSLHEAQAWCRWAGRRLPNEAEWELAAVQGATQAHFSWGRVWEWTASAFEPYPSFVPHPYRDYSQPWFGSRQVLRGASFATDPALRNLRYRNFFEPGRNDIFAGFRSCALSTD